MSLILYSVCTQKNSSIYSWDMDRNCPKDWLHLNHSLNSDFRGMSRHMFWGQLSVSLIWSCISPMQFSLVGYSGLLSDSFRTFVRTPLHRECWHQQDQSHATSMRLSHEQRHRTRHVHSTVHGRGRLEGRQKLVLVWEKSTRLGIHPTLHLHLVEATGSLFSVYI